MIIIRCKQLGCQNDAGINLKTGKPNPYCKEHYEQYLKSNQKGTSVNKTPLSNKTKPTLKPKIKKPVHDVETFILRGDILTVNSSNRTVHLKVDRFTRCVKFNEDVLDVSGNPGRYLLEIKQDGEVIKSLVYTKKYERENDFSKLQKLLSTL
jgi:hypothetical protein